MDTQAFRDTVWCVYEKHGRTLPWREANNYGIFVSEIMLQQTQATRVIPKYKQWIDRWSDFHDLASADRSAVLQAWQGLGFNRRAKFLHKSARQIVNDYEGSLPQSRDELQKLPGVGAYTSGALIAFCFNKPVVFVETNIRTVFIHHFFADTEDVTDTQIHKKLEETMPEDNIREWYYALMDYGTYLKKEVGNRNKQSKHYNSQSQFAGSNRQLRSELLRFILDNQPVALKEITNNIKPETDRQKSIEDNLADLVSEEMITQKDQKYQIKE